MLDIAALVASKGGRTIFLTAPAFFSAEANARHLQNRYVLPGDNVAAIHGSYQQEVRRLSEVTRARVCDIAQIFERVQEYESLLYPDGIHPTDLGHMVLASILADDIAVNELGAPDPHSDPAAVALAIIAQGLVASQQWGAALEKYRHAVRTAPQDLNLLLGYAWLLATCPTDSLRDPTSALNHLADYAGPTQAGYQFHDVKAAALAALGRYAEAVESAQAALSDLEALGGGESDLASGIRERLSLYEADQPYRLSLPQQQ